MSVRLKARRVKERFIKSYFLLLRFLKEKKGVPSLQVLDFKRQFNISS
jgi:hypothetical protein